MWRAFKKTRYAQVNWDALIWHSPSIFFGPLVRRIRKRNLGKSYLIVRDIFPQWAVDLGILRPGLVLGLLRYFERYQYELADTIGVQSSGNLRYFKWWMEERGTGVEVLQNWIAGSEVVGCSLQVNKTALAGRKILVYAGNMGVAQNLDILLPVAHKLRERRDIGFLFVGRGSEFARLKRLAQAMNFDNVLFCGEIPAQEIPGLYRQCAAGLVMLDPRHSTQNIPGKFLSAMRYGIPVVARVNPGNDLVDIINQHAVGKVTTDDSLDVLSGMCLDMVDVFAQDDQVAARCKRLASRMFSPQRAVKQILSSLEC
jgi:glycosyltransferase involved in cell wall biosynthesis